MTIWCIVFCKNIYACILTNVGTQKGTYPKGFQTGGLWSVRLYSCDCTGLLHSVRPCIIPLVSSR